MLAFAPCFVADPAKIPGGLETAALWMRETRRTSPGIASVPVLKNRLKTRIQHDSADRHVVEARHAWLFRPVLWTGPLDAACRTRGDASQSLGWHGAW